MIILRKNKVKPNNNHDKLQKRLKVSREAWTFAANFKQQERAKEKLDEVQKLEDELEPLLD